jgi:DNA-binding IclR family transcriptional regulator
MCKQMPEHNVASLGKVDAEEPATGTLGKAMTLLELVVMAPEPLRFTEILNIVGQPRGTVHRQLTHLLQEGLLELDAHQAYVPGLRLLKFAGRAWARNDLRSVATPYLRELQSITGESVHLGILRDTEVIYLDKVEGNRAIRMHSQIGNASPVFCTGVGKAALATLAQDRLKQTVDNIQFRSFTSSTITNPKALLAEIETIRVRGYGFDLAEHEEGIHCVAAPIICDGHDFAAAVSVTGPAYRLTPQNLESLAPIVCKIATKIATDISLRISPSSL